MKQKLFYSIASFIACGLLAFGGLAYFSTPKTMVGSTITDLVNTMTGSTSMKVINDNFDNLNTDLTAAEGDIDDLQASSTNWDTAYGWGNHASAGYISQAYGSSTYAMQSSNFINQAYGSSTYALLSDNYMNQAYASTTFPTYTYASSTYITYSNPIASVNLGAYNLTTTGAVNMASTTISDTAYVNQVCFTGTGNCQTDIVSAGTNIDFFYHNQSSDIAGYERLRTYPNNGTEIAETATSANGVLGLIDPYVSTSTDIVLSGIPAGTWRFRSWANVDSNVGVTKLVNRVYKRASTGAETLLFSATSSEMTTGLKEYLYNGISASTTFETTDRLVIKNYCWTDSGSTKTCTFYYDGADHYSYVSSPISIAELDYPRKTANETITGTWTFNSTISGTTSGNPAETTSTIGILINGSTASTSPADTDRFAFSDSSLLRYITWSNIKAALKTYFDTLYALLAGSNVWTGVNDFGGATRLEVPNGATMYTNTTGDVAIDTTSGQLRYNDGTATRTVAYFRDPAFTIASTTLIGGAGTTTIPLGYAASAETWSSAICGSDGGSGVGTTTLRFGDGTNYSNTLTATSTGYQQTLSSNNTFTAAEKRYLQVISTAGSPNYITCTIIKSIDAD